MEDKRIILHTREAEENEFVMQQTQLINSHFMKRVLDYVAANSNLDYEIMDRNNFVTYWKLPLSYQSLYQIEIHLLF